MKVIKFTKVNKVNKLNLEQFAHTPYSLQTLLYEDTSLKATSYY